MSMEGIIYQVRLFEIDLEDLNITTGNQLIWPTEVDGQKIPTVDGLLLLYDVTSKASTIGLADVLGK